MSGMTSTEVEKSPKTAKAFLKTVVDHLSKGGHISAAKMGEVALATITMPDGARFNLSAHRISGDENLSRVGISRSKGVPRPVVPGNQT